MENRQRIFFLDWLRAAACLMVLLVHACECVYSNDYSFSIPSESARWTIGLIQGFVRPIAVPLFLMASAYLLVPVTKSTGEFLKKRFTRVAIPFVVFLYLDGGMDECEAGRNQFHSKGIASLVCLYAAGAVPDHACDIPMASEGQ